MERRWQLGQQVMGDKGWQEETRETGKTTGKKGDKGRNGKKVATGPAGDK